MKHTQRLLVIALSLGCIVLIAWVDRLVHAGVPLGLLYLLPVALASTVLRRWEVPLLAVLCTATAEFSDAFQWTPGQGVPRDLLYFAAYAAVGLYISEALAKREAERTHLLEVEAEAEARRAAEEQLRLLVASSSIAIVTSDESGNILEANDAAERIFAPDGAAGEGRAKLPTRPLVNFLPSLARVPMDRQGRRHLRTMMQCQGLRAGGDRFLADVWFSTYETTRGARITAMVVDTSEDVRDREEANLEQVLEGSRLLVGAVSHEIRNVCAAIGLVQMNLLALQPGLGSEPDFHALRQLTGALERMASVELSQVKRQATEMPLEPFFRNLEIIVAGSLRAAEIDLVWAIEPGLPSVMADSQSLLQVFLNLLRNAQTALEEVGAEARIAVSAMRRGTTVEIRVTDNGPGVAEPERLFHPFAVRSRRTGFGLYLSRAMMNSVRGDLRYEPSARGAVFVVELATAEVAEGTWRTTTTETGHAMLTRQW